MGRDVTGFGGGGDDPDGPYARRPMTTAPEPAGLVATARRVGHHVWVERRTFEWLGAWSNVPTEPAVTNLFGEAAARHGWHAELLLERLPELRELGAEDLVRAVDPTAEAVLGALARPEDPERHLEALVGHVRVVLPRLVGSCRALLDAASPVADRSLARWLRLVVEDDLEEWSRGEALLRRRLVDEAAVERAAAHQRELETLLVRSSLLPE